MSKRPLRHTLIYYRFKIAQRFTDKRLVLELKDPSKLDHRTMPDEEVFSFSDFADIQPAVRDQLREVLGQDYLDTAETKLTTGFSHITTLLYKGRLGSVVWATNGKAVKKWVIPLTDHDFIFSGGFTVAEMRGRAMLSRCIAHSHDRLDGPGVRFLSDVHIYNAPALRQLQRTGYEIIARGRIPK